MNSKKPRSCEQRTKKPGTAARQVPVRIVISQSNLSR